MMPKIKRTPLNQLLGRAPEAPTPARAKPERAPTATRSVPTPAKEPLKQLNAAIPEGLHRRAKAKASLEGRTLVAVVEELLQGWVRG